MGSQRVGYNSATFTFMLYKGTMPFLIFYKLALSSSMFLRFIHPLYCYGTLLFYLLYINLGHAYSNGEGNGTPLQYSCLENPMDRRAWWAAVHGVAGSRTRLSDFTLFFTFMHWRRKWQPTPEFLPGESQGWGSLVSCHLWGRTELDTTEVT